jgi:hypothetical protein
LQNIPHKPPSTYAFGFLKRIHNSVIKPAGRSKAGVGVDKKGKNETKKGGKMDLEGWIGIEIYKQYK